jgi:hypothetical protein
MHVNRIQGRRPTLTWLRRAALRRSARSSIAKDAEFRRGKETNQYLRWEKGLPFSEQLLHWNIMKANTWSQRGDATNFYVWKRKILPLYVQMWGAGRISVRLRLQQSRKKFDSMYRRVVLLALAGSAAAFVPGAFVGTTPALAKATSGTHWILRQ